MNRQRKSNTVMKFLLVFFLLPLRLFAQDITGVWTGYLYNDTTKQYIKYELAVSEYNRKLSGYSHTIYEIDSVENIGVKSVKILKHGDSYQVEDDKLIYNNYTEPPAKGVKTYFDLVLMEHDSVMELRGAWKTNRTRIYKSITGNILLKKKRKFEETLIIPKLENLGLAKSLSFIPYNNYAKTGEIKEKPAIAQNPSIKPDGNISNNNPSKEKPGININENKDQVDLKSTNSPGKIEVVQPVKQPIPEAMAAKTINNNTAGENANNAITERQKIKNDTSIASIPRPKITNNTLKPPQGAKKPISGKNPAKKIMADTAVTENILSTGSPVDSKKIDTKVASFEKSDSITPIKKDLLTTTISKENASLVEKAAAQIATREIETIKSVDIKSDSIMLTLYDNGEVDGDTVSVLLNGKVVMPLVGLSTNAINKTIYLTPEMGDSIKLIMYAENLGSIPPNTGLLIVHDGENTYYIRFSGDLQKNSAIILKRKKKN